MATEDASQPAAYDLPLLQRRGVASESRHRGADSLPEPLLVRNILWFCRFRCLIIVVLLAAGVLSLFPGFLGRFGIRLGTDWPFLAAGILAVGNLLFLAHARALSDPGRSRAVTVNLWAQILLDLLVLTVVVHFVGSLETYVAFSYLFHIVLSCIFFSRRRSLAVTAFAGALYLACVLLEEAGVVAPAGIYADTALRDQIRHMPGVSVLNVTWVLVTWIVVGYLVSHLSEMVRERDSELAETNQRLITTQAEKTRHMLRTTHELKAPLAAIDANTQLLLEGYCGALEDEAREVVERIAARSRRLAGEIQEMLQLANLRAASAEPLPWAEVDLAAVLRDCIQQAGALARERDVRIDEELQPASTVAVADHVKVMFTNLLSNAILYSHEGGRVRVACRLLSPDRPEIVIEDEGIGISPDTLPRIFDEYFHTDEAVRHNRRSTGLGLAIVRQVADSHSIRLRVESERGQGTKFILRFPPGGAARASRST
jgi:signal transduction histidine kinase